jgi:hypothetical protein
MGLVHGVSEQHGLSAGGRARGERSVHEELRREGNQIRTFEKGVFARDDVAAQVRVEVQAGVAESSKRPGKLGGALDAGMPVHHGQKQYCRTISRGRQDRMERIRDGLLRGEGGKTPAIGEITRTQVRKNSVITPAQIRANQFLALKC